MPPKMLLHLQQSNFRQFLYRSFCYTDRFSLSEPVFGRHMFEFIDSLQLFQCNRFESERRSYQCQQRNTGKVHVQHIEEIGSNLDYLRNALVLRYNGVRSSLAALWLL